MNGSKVLVVAPRFPSINQPWIDTYLEQLIRNGFDFSVYTLNNAESVYGEKVDRLGFRGRIIDFDLTQKANVLKCIWELLVRPAATVCALAKSIKILCDCVRYKVPSLAAFFCMLQFIGARTKFTGVSIIHSHEEIAGFSFMLLARLLEIPFVLTFHGLPPAGVAQLSRAKRWMMYDSAGAVVVNTGFAKLQVRELGARDGTIVILPQGLPIADFSFAERAPVLRHHKVKLLTVGRYHRDKGQRYALLAARRLVDQCIEVSWNFVGVGPDLVRLELIARRLGIEHVVTFMTGITTQEIGRLYRESDFFVLPSVTSPGGHVETQGVVLQEAQASGCIPIASRSGGIPECLNHMRDAILVRQRSSREIADAITYLLDNPEKQSGFRNEGRRNVEERYSADDIGRQMARILSAQSDFARKGSLDLR